jgi:hypothetical protein
MGWIYQDKRRYGIMGNTESNESPESNFDNTLAESVSGLKSDLEYDPDKPIMKKPQEDDDLIEVTGDEAQERSKELTEDRYTEGDKNNDLTHEAEWVYNPDKPILIGRPEPSYCIPRTGGKWDGEPADSVWKPDLDTKPTKYNPNDLTWGEILAKYGIDGIPFVDGEPDFSKVSKGTVEIDDFSENRDDNFDAADEALAKERGCTKEEVKAWRKEHGYNWHERSDMKTLDKVPGEVHLNVPHDGGISAKKKDDGNE